MKESDSLFVVLSLSDRISFFVLVESKSLHVVFLVDFSAVHSEQTHNFETCEE